MIRNYILVALRNILKYKFFSAINILGMTIGVSLSLLIILYISDELSFDKFHPQAERIYQAGLHGKISGQDIRTTTTCPPLGPAMVMEIPEVESSTRMLEADEPVVRNGANIFTEQKVFFADSNFFDFFGYKLIAGDAKTALAEPNTLVLTEAMAKKYFGKEDPLGKLLTVGDQKKVYKVTGIAVSPANSHFIFHILLSAKSTNRLQTTEWLNNFMYTYFKIRPNTRVEDAVSKFDNLVVKYIGPEVEKFLGTTLSKFKEAGGEYGYYATNIQSIHLYSTSQGDIEPGGNIMYIYFFGGIGIFIVVIACINFMNLSTARSSGRAKEVGLRKALGSRRGQMVAQFLSESMLFSITSVILAFIACYFLLPFFNELSGKTLGMETLWTPLFLGALALVAVFVGFISGSYPAFYLTSFSAVEVLKGKIRSGMKSKGIRSTMVVIQFALSILLIIFTAVVFQQLSYMQEKNLGFDKNNILVMHKTYRLEKNKEPFRNALLQQTGILKTSDTNNSFPGVNNTTVFKTAISEQDHIMGVYYADIDHQDVLKFELSEGRYFSGEFASDTLAIVINEAAAREFGFDHPLGEELLYMDDGTAKKMKIIGIIKNFNFESFKTGVRPLSILLTKEASRMLVRYEGNPKTIVENIEKLWKQYAAEEPMEYTFLDENFDSLFRAEQRMGKLFSIFSGLAIFIACLGLFALAAFTSEQRTKEIGVRKTMGASVLGITLMLSKEFTWLVLIAFIPAAGIGWYLSSTWLEGFAYRIEINPMLFLFSGLSAIVIAWLTVSYQAIKAAKANPVDSLRYE